MAENSKPQVKRDGAVVRDGLTAGAVAHVAISLGWGTVLAVAVRRLSLLSLAAPAATVGGTTPIPRAVVAGVVAGAVLRCRG